MIYTGNLRSAKATDTYIADTNGADGAVFMPAFTYHGFRFVEVSSSDPSFSLAAKDIELHHFHSAVPVKAQASFSSDTLNRIQKLAVGAQRSNMMTVPTDCDQRDERGSFFHTCPGAHRRRTPT